MAAPRKELYNKYADELVKNAKLISARGKGILAADESTGTIGKRFDAIKVKNVEENRRLYRQLLFTTKGLEKYISGVILFEETLYQKCDDGTSFADLLKQKGIFIGLKVDEGLKEIPYTAAETYTQGFTNLDVRCAKYYAAGSRFAKWRATLTIKGDELPSELAYHETAWSLARYAAICQKFGLVPVVEPETLMDGNHSIQRCAEVTEKVVGLCYTYLAVNRVVLEGTLLKPNMVIAGQDSKTRSTAAEVGYWTSKVLKRTVPAAVPGINFLSGGQSEEEATVNLNAINAADNHPWTLSFSYGRALQKSVLKAWGGKKENVAKAQAVLMQRAAANSAATWGKYHGEAATADATASLFVKDYKY